MNGRTSSIAGPYIERIRNFYDAAPTESTWFGRFYRTLLAKYYRYLIPGDASILEIGCGSGELLSLLPNGHFVESAAENMKAEAGLNRTFDYIVLSGDRQLHSERSGSARKTASVCRRSYAGRSEFLQHGLVSGVASRHLARFEVPASKAREAATDFQPPAKEPVLSNPEEDVSAIKFVLFFSPPVQAELSKLRLDQCRWAVAARVSMLRGVSFLRTTVMETGSPLLREGGVDAT